MKKEDQLLDNLLREYHEAGDGDDQKFMDSVLNEVKEKKQISDSSPTQIP